MTLYRVNPTLHLLTNRRQCPETMRGPSRHSECNHATEGTLLHCNCCRKSHLEQCFPTSFLEAHCWIRYVYLGFASLLKATGDDPLGFDSATLTSLCQFSGIADRAVLKGGATGATAPCPALEGALQWTDWVEWTMLRTALISEILLVLLLANHFENA